MEGDLFYLTVRTLDAGEIGITSSVNGFFRNDSNEKSTFSPGPSKRHNPCYSYSLGGSLFQLSPMFGKRLETYFNSILRTEPYFLYQSNLPVHFWLKNTDEPEPEAKEGEFVPLYGLDPKGIRDWNEEFQVVKDFPKESFLNRI